ncbi:hypothetical protein [Aurantimonas sp. VKM B-3413]|uniref:hypothetical protein n=1 Tax=Aurantimonas sp. VKM B-3413 TaxID=2779401 RepID=UPI001E2C5054|nr:hypothetical protein [Aurantimonas sp. VKM B-3413]MCB8840240.1 hypothetical protein [Aurantimonas sp. VKM B-3413]
MNNVHNLREPVTIDLKPETAARIAVAQTTGRHDIVEMLRIIADVVSQMSEDESAVYAWHGVEILARRGRQNLADRKDTVVPIDHLDRNSSP